MVVLLNPHRFGGEVPEELIYSWDFTSGDGVWTGAAINTTMAAAVGTSKPGYSHTDQRQVNLGSIGPSATEISSALDLSTLAEASGRTLTRLLVWHCRQGTHTSSATGRTCHYEILQNGVLKFNETIVFPASVGTLTRAWAQLEILNPTGIFKSQLRNGTGSTTSMPTVTMVVTGFELYAEV